MRIFKRLRGPKLGTKIVLLGLLVLVIPTWISNRQLVELERILIQAQSQTQLKTAQGISSLFNGREDLFQNLPLSLDDYEALFANPMQNPIRFDGKDNDWEELDGKQRNFGLESGSTGDAGFELTLGERDGQLNVLMKIRDQDAVLRDENTLRLDSADHVRLKYIQASGEDARVTLTFPEGGVITAYDMDVDWKFSNSGPPNNNIQGHVTHSDSGYLLEFRMPLDMLGSRRYFGLSFVDVDDEVSREVRTIIQTLPRADKAGFNLVVRRSPELLNIVEGLGYSGARIVIIDSDKRVRAQTGSLNSLRANTPDGNWIASVRNRVQTLQRYINQLSSTDDVTTQGENAEQITEQLVQSALAGAPAVLRRTALILQDSSDVDGKKLEQEIIMAAHPIISKDRILGTVIVEQNIDEIATFQRNAAEQIILLSTSGLLIVFLALLTFAGRLAWRIRNLRRETSRSIDERGRLRPDALKSEINASDEIGDLARSVSGLLAKLHQHNRFLENMPRTLRHEINNPLNTLSTSLQNLAEEAPEIQNSRYLESAKRGVLRIGAIVQNLADAANLEEALQSEEVEIIDVHKLIENYVTNCNISHKGVQFQFRGSNAPIYACVADYRIEQLLDKLIDNAIDFHRSNSAIKVQVDTYRGYLQIAVANRGPTLPHDDEESLFDSMVSHRRDGPQNKLHFGLGLYVVRIIAEYHGGNVRAMNLVDGSGVAVVVQLPLAQPPGATHIRAFDNIIASRTPSADHRLQNLKAS